MSKEYKFSTIKELFYTIPSDKIEQCLKELGVALLQAKAVQTTMEALEQPFEYPMEMTWIDDDKEEITSVFHDIESGQEVGSIKMYIKQ